ncbi:MAG: hypothetical protein IJJ33_00415 [Victivallales bacterium]|nr:hypothetical protein [Victivallales bacterium]
MHLTQEPKPTLAICLNPAWQKTLTFTHLTHGEVNRAQKLTQCGGGKGVNVARVYRLFGWPITLATFIGGETGRLLKEELLSNGTTTLLQETAGVTRCCTTLISADNHEVTEIIEPSATVSPQESESLLEKVLATIPTQGAVVFSGSMAPGVHREFCTAVARQATQHGIPFVLDAVKDIDGALAAGVCVLKINAAELRQIAQKEDLAEAARALLDRFPALSNLAITDGARPAHLFNRQGNWRIEVPPLPGGVVSAIGGGDCTAAVLTRRIAEGASGAKLTEAFAEALSCASASCLTATPSVFELEQAQRIRAQIQICQE